MLTDPQVRAQLLAIPEESWMKACQSFWEISPNEPPTKSLQDDVRRRLHWIKSPNRKNVGKAAEMPLDFVKAATRHLVELGLREDDNLPCDTTDWVNLLDAVAAHLSIDYAAFCRVVAPPDLEWTPTLEGANLTPTADPPTSPVEGHAIPPDTQRAGEDGAAAPEELNRATAEQATSSHLTGLLDQLRLAGSALSEALEAARCGIDETQLIEADLAGPRDTWNSLLTELALGLHGHHKYLTGFEHLQAGIDAVREQEDSQTRLQETLAEKTALLQQYQAQCDGPLYAQDADYRALVANKIAELEQDISQLPVVHPVSAEPATDAPETAAVHLADLNPTSIPSPQSDASSRPDAPAVIVEQESDQKLPPTAVGVAVDNDGASEPAEKVETEPSAAHDVTADPAVVIASDSQDTEPTTPEPGNDVASVPGVALIPEAPEQTYVVDDDESEPSDAVSHRGLAELVTQNRWAAAGALAPVSTLDIVAVQALNFCAESFCLPIISTDPHEMLGRNAGFIAEALQTSGSAALLTAVGLLRACLSVGREQSWLLTEESLDCLPGRWRDVARELRDAVADGYQHHHWDHGPAVNSVLPPASLKRRAEELLETLPKRGNKYAPAGNVLRHMMGSDGDLRLALEAVSLWVDGNGDVESLRIRRTVLDDPRKLVDRVDAAIPGRAKHRKETIVSAAFDSLAMRISEVAALLDHAIVLGEAGDAKRRPTAGKPADTVSKIIEGLPEVELDGTLEAAALDRFRIWLISGDGPSADTGRSFAQLKFVSTLPAVSAVRDKQLNLPVRCEIPAMILIDEVLTPGSDHDLFHAYLETGNLAAAEALGGGVDGALAFRTAEREWRNRIDRRAVGLQTELTRLQAQTQIDLVERAQLDGDVSALKISTDNRFDITSRRADQIATELDEVWTTTRNELTTSLRELDLTVGIAGEDANRIRSLIEQNDFITAREFMSILTNDAGQLLPRAHDDGLVALQEFRALLEEWPDSDASAAAVAEVTLGSTPSEKVATALRAWNQAGRVRKPTEWERLLPSILGLLGLEKIPDQPVTDRTERNQSRFAKFIVKAKPNGGSYIAALGSKTRRKGYTVYALAPDTSVDSIFDDIPTGERREANVVLFPGVLNWEERKYLREAADKEKITALVADTAVVAHMASQPERLFTTLQRITLPFSIFQHWAPRVAGDVPDELFVGRADLIDNIVSPDGSIFVYGGRQLGKSALLHRIERDFNRLDKKLAIYIDFKVERIGEENEPEYLWTVLRNRLQDAKVIPAANTSTKTDAIEKAIRDWLDADPERAILLLCDETDAFLQNEARERVIAKTRVGSFPNVAVLKGLMDKTQRRFKPVFAGLHQVQRIADTPNSPLAHGGEDILVGPLTSGEAWELVVRPFKALGYQFETVDLVWRLLAFTNRHAGLVQIVCDELYKRMRSSQTDITPGQPPYVIRAADVDSVITSPKIRDFIAERFRLTIQLEDRYFVIAMVVALLGLDSGFDNRYSRSQILDSCRTFWQGGFNTLTEEQLSVYLDEMVDLNVLIHSSHSTHYGMRSPNVVHMLGDRETIEKQLLEGRFELPLQYNANLSRRRLSDARGRERYSPLSEYELSRVMPKRNGERDRYAVAVIGSPALGIHHVRDLLATASQEDYEYPLNVVSADEARELVAAGTGAIARRPLVVCEASDRPECLREVVERISAAGKIGRRAVLLGPFAATARHELVAHDVEVIPLRPWTVETVRATIDNPITTPEQRDAFINATGGWPALCEEFLNQIRTGTTVAEAIARANAFPDNPDHAQQFLSAVGLTDGHDLALLGPWAEFAHRGDTVDEETLTELLAMGSDELLVLLGRLALLSVVHEQSTGYALNEVVRRSLIAIGAADAG